MCKVSAYFEVWKKQRNRFLGSVIIQIVWTIIIMVSLVIDRLQQLWHSPACHWLHSANWQVLTLAVVSTVLALWIPSLVFKLYLKYEKSRYYLPNIPIIRGVPYFGLTKLLLLDKEFKSHEEVLRIVREQGPITQFYLLGQRVVLINEGFIAKNAMEHLPGKGMFHQIGGTTLSTFSLDTNPLWKQRRRTFRHAFTTLNLKTQEKKMNMVVDRLCEVLNQKLSHMSDFDFQDTNTAFEESKVADESQKQIVKIDGIFGSFALDVIYNIGFDLDRNFLCNHDLYEKMNMAIIEMFALSRIANLPLFKLFTKYRIPLPTLNKYHRAMSTIREFTMDILQSIREKYRTGSLHTQCFAKMLLDFAVEEALTDEELLSEILLFMVAGHETTAHSLAWIVYAMVKDSAVQTRCHEELSQQQQVTRETKKLFTKPSGTAPAPVPATVPSSSSLSNPSRYVTRSRLKQTAGTSSTSVDELSLDGPREVDCDYEEKIKKPSATTVPISSLSLLPPYLEAVVKESMRKYPAASRGSMRLVRASEGGITLSLRTLHDNPFVHQRYPDEIQLPEGTWILMNIFALHNWEGNWGDDVDEFKPERFLALSGAEGGNKVLASPAAFHGGGFVNQQLIFAPFSYGARNCLGMNIAIWEIRSVVSRLLRDYRFELAEEDLRDEHVALKTDITLKPVHQLPVHIYARCLHGQQLPVLHFQPHPTTTTATTTERKELLTHSYSPETPTTSCIILILFLLYRYSSTK